MIRSLFALAFFGVLSAANAAPTVYCGIIDGTLRNRVCLTGSTVWVSYSGHESPFIYPVVRENDPHTYGRATEVTITDGERESLIVVYNDEKNGEPAELTGYLPNGHYVQVSGLEIEK